jgi:hypothetical protein
MHLPVEVFVDGGKAKPKAAARWMSAFDPSEGGSTAQDV